ncbi:hypothetical protein ES703_88944 [subsurface metagenome]
MMIYACIGLANTYISLDQPTKAIKFLKLGLETAKRTGYLDGIKDSSGLLSKAYAKTGNYKEAYLAHVEYKSKVEEITRLEMQYEFDKKQQEQDFINKQKNLAYLSELKQQKTLRNAAISGAFLVIVIALITIYYYRLRQKEKVHKLQSDLFLYMQKSLSQQMNPHFIFNTLNSIQYFIHINNKEASLDYIGKFASLMRMALYNSQYPTIPLQDELEILKLYPVRITAAEEYDLLAEYSADEKKSTLISHERN